MPDGPVASSSDHLQIMDIPRLAQRLDCMLFRRKFELDIEEIRPDLEVLHFAAKELKTSTRFKTVLQAVLTVGNALNGSTYRGGARGFQLESLLKVRLGAVSVLAGSNN